MSARWALAAVGLMCVVWGSVGCQSRTVRDYEPVVAQFLLETHPEVPGALVAELPRSGVQIVVAPSPVLSEMDVRDVELVRVDLGLCLLFEFTGEGARALLQLTAGQLGRRIVLTLNGCPFGARLIDGPVSDGRLFMFVELDDAELTLTSVNLKRTAAELQAAVAAGRRSAR